LAAQGLQGFFAAHGLHGFFAAQGLHGFFAAQGFLAQQGLHGLFAQTEARHGFFGAHCATPSDGTANAIAATATPAARVVLNMLFDLGMVL
jgi:hypothetical protein